MNHLKGGIRSYFALNEYSLFLTKIYMLFCLLLINFALEK